MILCTVYEYLKSELAIKLYIDTDKGECQDKKNTHGGIDNKL